MGSELHGFNYKEKIEEVRKEAAEHARTLYRQGFSPYKEIPEMMDVTFKTVYRWLELDNISFQDKIEHEKNKILRKQIDKESKIEGYTNAEN